MARHRTARTRTARASAVAVVTLVLMASAPLVAANAGESVDNAPSERGVLPVVTDTGEASPRNECRTLTGREDVVALQVGGEGAGFPTDSPYGDGTVEVSFFDWDAQAKSFAWSSSLPLLGVWVKGGSGGEGNWYDYATFLDLPPAPGADHDAELHTKPNPAGPAGLSHVTVCYQTPSQTTPDLTLVKSSDADGMLSVGDRFSYEIVVTNIGAATAHDVELVDDLPPGVQVRTIVPNLDGGPCTVTSSKPPGGRFVMSVICRRPTLAAGASASVVFDAEVTSETRCGSVRNVATVSADDEPRGVVDGANADAATVGVRCAPSISLEKSGPALAHEGDTVTYAFVVTNDGEADLRAVDVSDARCDSPVDAIDLGDGDPVLGPRESWRYRCTSTIGEDDPTRNTARVTATDGNDVVSDVDTHLIDVLHPSVRLAKTVTPDSGAVGEIVTYSYRVTNMGDAPLFDLVVADDVMGSIGVIDALAPGATRTLTEDYVLPATDIRAVNVGTVVGVDALGLSVTDTSSASISIVAGSGSASGGDRDGSGGETDGGTAFTGTDAATPARTALALFVLGMLCVGASVRRSPAP